MESAAEPAADPILDLRQVRKAFGETIALNDVSVQIWPQRVHTVLGENGSGKSTLVKVLSGVLGPDRGAVVINGQKLAPATPRRARELGVATVFQEVLVAPNRSVVENVMLGQDSWFRYSSKGTRRRDIVAEVLGELSNEPFGLDAAVGSLGLVQRHQVAIARALILRPRVLVLDESTAALDVHDRDRLFEAVRRRVQQGTAVVFISHRMEEVLELSDEVTVLRSGRLIETLQREDLSESRLMRLLNPSSKSAL